MLIDNPEAFGGRAKISLHNPAVQMNQISMSQLWIESGEPSQLNSIQVGWAVINILPNSSSLYITHY